MNKSWINFVSKRFSLVDHKGSTAVNSRLATAGICLGVMTLITVMSVMNGFQHKFIDSILEISSYHAQAENLSQEDEKALFDFSSNKIVAAVPYLQAQSLVVSESGKESPALIRAIHQNVMEMDLGFKNEIKMVSGYFALDEEDSIVLGYKLAKSLGVKTGSKINLFAVSGSSSVPLINNNRIFTVKGIFSCGYHEINSMYAFINLDAGKKVFGTEDLIYGIKIKNPDNYKGFEKLIKKKIPDIKISFWDEYNKSFFSALRTEKNMLFLMTVLIFIVVAVNIFNSMRKLVYSRQMEIAAMSALGGNKKDIQLIFVFRGLKTGLLGSLPGLVLGIFLSLNVSKVFMLISKCQYLIQYAIYSITDPSQKLFLTENPMYAVYASISARMIPSEIIMITLFGILSCVISSWLASRNVLKISISEVLHED